MPMLSHQARFRGRPPVRVVQERGCRSTGLNPSARMGGSRGIPRKTSQRQGRVAANGEVRSGTAFSVASEGSMTHRMRGTLLTLSSHETRDPLLVVFHVQHSAEFVDGSQTGSGPVRVPGSHRALGGRGGHIQRVEPQKAHPPSSRGWALGPRHEALPGTTRVLPGGRRSMDARPGGPRVPSQSLWRTQFGPLRAVLPERDRFTVLETLISRNLNPPDPRKTQHHGKKHTGYQSRDDSIG